MYVVGWSANLKCENLEFATLSCRWVSELLEMGNFRVCNISMYAVGECKPEMGKFRVCNILCMYMGGYKITSLKWETSDLQHFVCVCVCLLQTSNLKWEI